MLSLFDNVYKVDFDEKVYDKITTIRSQEDEAVPLTKSVLAQVSYLVVALSFLNQKN